MATTVYLIEPGMHAHKEGERLIIRKDSKTVGDIPLIQIRQVTVIGRGIEITCEAMLAMVERKIDVCFFSKSMRLRGRMVGQVSYNGRLRFLQARFIDSLPFQLALAKLIVQGKLNNQRRMLLPQNKSAAGTIAQVIQNLTNAATLDELRGYEGYGASVYFEGLRKLIPNLAGWNFTHREFYPPPDPINALLSFGYSLLTRDVLAAVELVGLDPYLGFFHAIDYGRPSLALDLMEEFRPIVVDRLVLRLLNDQAITLADFEQGRVRSEEDGGKAIKAVLLKPSARNLYLETYEEMLNGYVNYPLENRQQPLRRVIELQVRQIARLISGETNEYSSFNL
jgi:CRISP-associated protein Cas1